MIVHMVGCVYSLRDQMSLPGQIDMPTFSLPNVSFPNFSRPTVPEADVETGANVALLSGQQSNHQ